MEREVQKLQEIKRLETTNPLDPLLDLLTKFGAKCKTMPYQIRSD